MLGAQVGSSASYNQTAPCVTDTMERPGCECQPLYPPGITLWLVTTTSDTPLTFKEAFQSGRFASTSKVV